MANRSLSDRIRDTQQRIADAEEKGQQGLVTALERALHSLFNEVPSAIAYTDKRIRDARRQGNGTKEQQLQKTLSNLKADLRVAQRQKGFGKRYSEAVKAGLIAKTSKPRRVEAPKTTPKTLKTSAREAPAGPNSKALAALAKHPDSVIGGFKTERLSAIANRLGVSRPGGREDILKAVLKKVHDYRGERPKGADVTKPTKPAATKTPAREAPAPEEPVSGGRKELQQEVTRLTDELTAVRTDYTIPELQREVQADAIKEQLQKARVRLKGLGAEPAAPKAAAPPAETPAREAVADEYLELEEDMETYGEEELPEGAVAEAPVEQKPLRKFRELPPPIRNFRKRVLEGQNVPKGATEFPADRYTDLENDALAILRRRTPSKDFDSLQDELDAKQKEAHELVVEWRRGNLAPSAPLTDEEKAVVAKGEKALEKNAAKWKPDEAAIEREMEEIRHRRAQTARAGRVDTATGTDESIDKMERDLAAQSEQRLGEDYYVQDKPLSLEHLAELMNARGDDGPWTAEEVGQLVGETGVDIADLQEKKLMPETFGGIPTTPEERQEAIEAKEKRAAYRDLLEAQGVNDRTERFRLSVEKYPLTDYEKIHGRREPGEDQAKGARRRALVAMRKTGRASIDEETGLEQGGLQEKVRHELEADLESQGITHDPMAREEVIEELGQRRGNIVWQQFQDKYGRAPTEMDVMVDKTIREMDLQAEIPVLQREGLRTGETRGASPVMTGSTGASPLDAREEFWRNFRRDEDKPKVEAPKEKQEESEYQRAAKEWAYNQQTEGGEVTSREMTNIEKLRNLAAEMGEPLPLDDPEGDENTILEEGVPAVGRMRFEKRQRIQSELGRAFEDAAVRVLESGSKKEVLLREIATLQERMPDANPERIAELIAETAESAPARLRTSPVPAPQAQSDLVKEGQAYDIAIAEKRTYNAPEARIDELAARDQMRVKNQAILEYNERIKALPSPKNRTPEQQAEYEALRQEITSLTTEETAAPAERRDAQGNVIPREFWKQGDPDKGILTPDPDARDMDLGRRRLSETQWASRFGPERPTGGTLEPPGGLSGEEALTQLREKGYPNPQQENPRVAVRRGVLNTLLGKNQEGESPPDIDSFNQFLRREQSQLPRADLTKPQGKYNPNVIDPRVNSPGYAGLPEPNTHRVLKLAQRVLGDEAKRLQAGEDPRINSGQWREFSKQMRVYGETLDQDDPYRQKILRFAEVGEGFQQQAPAGEPEPIEGRTNEDVKAARKRLVANKRAGAPADPPPPSAEAIEKAQAVMAGAQDEDDEAEKPNRAAPIPEGVLTPRRDPPILPEDLAPRGPQPPPDELLKPRRPELPPQELLDPRTPPMDPLEILKPRRPELPPQERRKPDVMLPAELLLDVATTPGLLARSQSAPSASHFGRRAQGGMAPLASSIGGLVGSAALLRPQQFEPPMQPIPGFEGFGEPQLVPALTGTVGQPMLSQSRSNLLSAWQQYRGSRG